MKLLIVENKEFIICESEWKVDGFEELWWR